jgi:hypothetical protein
MTKVLYEKRNRIGYITLNRPETLNALDDELNSELWAVWDDFGRDDSLDVGILTGAGKAFCSGADLKTFIPKWEKANMLDVRRNVPTGIGGGITRGQHRIIYVARGSSALKRVSFRRLAGDIVDWQWCRCVKWFLVEMASRTCNIMIRMIPRRAVDLRVMICSC